MFKQDLQMIGLKLNNTSIFCLQVNANINTITWSIRVICID